MNKVYTSHKSVIKADFNPDDYVTIFSDASYCHQTGAAGYAGWVKYGSSGKTLKVSDCFRSKSSEEAETYGIYETIREALDKGVIIKGKNIIIQCDCIGALNKLDLTVLLDKKPSRVKLKHVKGHSGTGNPRSAVNNWCDKEAKSQMVKLRNIILGV